MKNIWAWVKNWWENNKQVVEAWVLPQLDKAVAPLAQFLVSKGQPTATATQTATDIVAWVKEYLKRQL